jgi:hypothetical protein
MNDTTTVHEWILRFEYYPYRSFLAISQDNPVHPVIEGDGFTVIRPITIRNLPPDSPTFTDTLQPVECHIHVRSLQVSLARLEKCLNAVGQPDVKFTEGWIQIEGDYLEPPYPDLPVYTLTDVLSWYPPAKIGSIS